MPVKPFLASPPGGEDEGEAKRDRCGPGPSLGPGAEGPPAAAPPAVGAPAAEGGVPGVGEGAGSVNLPINDPRTEWVERVALSGLVDTALLGTRPYTPHHSPRQVGGASAEILTAPYERTRHKSTSSCAGQSGRSARDGRLEEGCFNVERPKAFDGALEAEG